MESLRDNKGLSRSPSGMVCRICLCLRHAHTIERYVSARLLRMAMFRMQIIGLLVLDTCATFGCEYVIRMVRLRESKDSVRAEHATIQSRAQTEANTFK